MVEVVEWKPYHPAPYRNTYSSRPFAWPDPPPRERVAVTLDSFSTGDAIRKLDPMVAHLNPVLFRKFETWGEGGHHRYLEQQALIADACEMAKQNAEGAIELLLKAGDLQMFDGYEVTIKKRNGGTLMSYQVVHPLNFNERGYYGGTAYETSLYGRYGNVFWPEPLRIPETYQDPTWMRYGQDGIVWQMPFEVADGPW